MKSKIILLIIFIFIVLIGILAYLNYKKSELKLQQSRQQIDLINAQTAAQEACKKNWLCVTQSIMGNDGLTGLAGGIAGILSGGLSGLFNGG